jgi:hypothetical protein
MLLKGFNFFGKVELVFPNDFCARYNSVALRAIIT